MRISLSESDGIGMSPELAAGLKAIMVPKEIVEDIRTIMINTKRGSSSYAHARGMDAAWEEYGIEGVRANLMYMLADMKYWKGEEARKVKKVLNAWIKKGQK